LIYSSGESFIFGVWELQGPYTRAIYVGFIDFQPW
jgi:hypothetical protein